MNLGDLRKEYRLKELRGNNLHKNPLNQFLLWLIEAQKAQVLEPTAMVLGTATKAGNISTRTVLLKHVGEDGFIFFTNYESRKAHEIAENPNVSATFLWKELERQVNIHGTVKKISIELSREYFSRRPRKSQLGSACSKQGSPIGCRKVLENEYSRLEKMYAGKEIPMPENWGGYIIEPYYYEFWQGRENRLHDRFEYRLEENEQWKISRLSP